jgi:hypothetical protein
MTENPNRGADGPRSIDPELRYKYLGFEVKPGKIENLFGSDSEKESWIKKILDKRKAGIRLREDCSLTEPRVASYERIVLTITSLLIVFSLFLPWFSGVKEIEIESAPTTQQQAGAATGAAVDQAAQKDDQGFSSITGIKKKKEIRREYYSMSAMGALASIGDVGGKIFSSGIILMFTGFLFIIYMLLCLGLAGYTIYSIHTLKGDSDTVALKLKKILKYSWAPVIIWVFCLLISVIGADYSFNTAGSLKQLGSSYGISAYLGFLTYGFYLSLAAFVLNAVKAIEI